MVVKVENGVRAALIKIVTFLLISWSTWATASILDLREHRAYTKGTAEDILRRLDSIEKKVDQLQAQR